MSVRSWTRWIGAVLVVGGLVLLPACDSGGTNGGGNVAGDWRSTIETDSVTYQLSFELAVLEGEETTGTRLVGDGEFAGRDSTWAIQIPNGTFQGEVLALTLRFDTLFDGQQRPLKIEGRVGDDYQEISADIFGGPPQFEGRSTTLTRPQ